MKKLYLFINNCCRLFTRCTIRKNNFTSKSKSHSSQVHITKWSPRRSIWKYVILLLTQNFFKALYILAQFLHLYFPGLALETAFELFYSRIGQHTSVGNYWNDPYHQKLYLSYSQYLPYVNNEIQSPRSSEFKDALKKLNLMVLIGGPDDNVITPWQSR